MKASQKILVTIGIVVTPLLITSMVVIRDHIQTVFTNTPLEKQFKSIAVEKFEKVDFSANWNVTIKQGIGYKLELAVNDSSSFQPVVANVKGTLYFSMDTIDSKAGTQSIRARITTPSLKAIKSVNGTRIRLSNFQSDSLAVDLEEGCEFTGVDNKIKHISFKSAGRAWIELRETPDF